MSFHANLISKITELKSDINHTSEHEVTRTEKLTWYPQSKPHSS